LFRKDLYYQINTISVNVPDLKSRKEFSVLVKTFIRDINRQQKRAVSNISEEALKLMQTYSWPGNLVELKSVLERIIVLKSEGVIGVEDLPQSLFQGVKDFEF